MKTTTLLDRYKEENTETESQQKLITEFAPSTGLRLQVPLQWVPIQLMALNGTKWFWHQLQHLQKQNAGQEVFKTSTLELTTWT